MARGDCDETFLSYGYDEDRSNVLYSTFKEILPNIFQGTAFKKQYLSLLNERSIQDFSTFFFYLSSTADRKRKKNQFVKNAALHPIDCRYNDFKLDLKSGHDFIPQDLDS